MDYICLRSVHIHSTEEGRLVKSITAQIVSFSESKYFKYWRYKYFRKKVDKSLLKNKQDKRLHECFFDFGYFCLQGFDFR